MHHAIAWSVFGVLVLVMLILDLGLFHRKSHEIGIREALVWSMVWVIVALVFNAGIYFAQGRDAAVNFLSAYILERTLSFDNLFVFLLIFNYFHVHDRFHHRVLFWGILGALIMRALFIGFGIALVHWFSWTLYAFGAILLVTGIKLAFEKDKEIEPEKNIALRLFRRMMPVSESYEGGEFFVRKDHRWLATPLIIVLIVIETTDVVFAVDSVPAVLAISTDPFIVYTSNVFAILGLRALYFAIAALMRLFHHLHYGLSLILVLIGLKMLLAGFVKVPTLGTLGMIFVVLILSIIASLIWPQKTGEVS